jgi:glycosyltransferase involved in cell wall biosynthesis
MESVARQTLLPHELIIVDDGSADDTKEAVTLFAKKAKGSVLSVRYIYQENAGAPTARNTGVEAAEGEWVAFLDSDDLWLPTKLELQVQALRRFAGSSLACVTDAVYLNNPGLTDSAFRHAGTQCGDEVGIFPAILKRIAYGYHGLYLQTLVVSRQLVLDIGGFDPRLKLGDDTDLLFQIANRTSVCYVNLPLVEIDRTPNRSDGLIELARREKFLLEMYQHLYEGWLIKYPKLDSEIQKRILWRLQEVHSGWSTWHVIQGDYEKALESMSQAIRYRFTGKVALKWMLAAIVPSMTKSLILKRRAKTPPELLF